MLEHLIGIGPSSKPKRAQSDSVPDAARGTAPFDASDESDVSPEEGCHGARGQGGKKDERWTLKFDIAGSEPELMDRVKQILQDLQDELGISHHPYTC